MLSELSAGEVLGRYELLLPVAQGGMASVWAARLKGTRGFQKMVAIKTMLPSLVDDPHVQRMFLEEAQLASQVRHPHVIETLDLGEHGGIMYLVMEWVDGEPLSLILSYAANRGGVPLSIAVLLATQACRGLHAAHELRDDSGALVGLVHRDISPQNVLVTYDGVVKLVDFGVAKATARATASQTEAGQLKGKIAYMSPEQLRGEKIDRRSDVFAMGILLYMMTTGRHPFRGEDQADTIAAISSDAPAIAPSSLVPAFPKALEQVIFQALAKDPAKRYPTANEMLIGLSRALPPSMRAATDEEVADFLRRLLPDRLEKRKRAIRAALDAADRREAGASVRLNEPTDEVPTVLEGFVSNPASTLPGAASSQPPPPGEVQLSAGRRVLLALAGALLVVVAGGLLFAVFSRPKAPAVESSNAVAAGSLADPAPAVTAPAAVASSEPSTPEPAESALSPPQPTNTPGLRSSGRRAPKREPKSTPAIGGDDTFVSPIRDPGF